MKYFLDPFGCVKNQVDAENMMAHLNGAGWESTTDADLSDLIIVNTCGFIESAKKESINAVIEWRDHYPNKKILVTGCLSQRYAKELPELLSEADAFIGVEDPSKIVQAANDVTAVSPNSTCNSQLSFSNLTGERPLLSLPGSAYIKISDGCDNCCSYCAIPLIRGSLVSRTIPDIVEECRALLKRGIFELNIIGQDIGAYGADLKEEITQRHGGTEEKQGERSKLPELLNAISEIDGDFWVRLLYIHPDHFPLEILDIMVRDKRFIPYFDIPFQHASAKILTAMNRNKAGQCDNSANKYLALLENIRFRLPDAVIRSTFLIGFPGETEEDFAELLDFQRKAKLDWLGCFAFSREEGTAAYAMKERIPARTANLRKLKIEELQIQITEKNMDRFTGQNLNVLIEEQFTSEFTEDDTDNNENLWLGRLFCHAPEIDGTAVIISSEKNLRIGTIIKCKVTARRGFDLEVRV